MVKLEMLVEGLPGYQTDYAPVDYAAIAHAMRIDATRVTAPGEVRAGLTEALNSPGPFLLDVVNDPNALSIPPHVTAAQVRGLRPGCKQGGPDRRRRPYDQPGPQQPA